MTLIDEIQEMVFEWCGDPAHRWWRWHVESVVKYSKLLSQGKDVDEEILEISALLHDIKKIRDDEREKHHITGADAAGKLLEEMQYPSGKIERVRQCILTHSSDKNYVPESKEAAILYNADALSHFDNFMAFAHWVYSIDKLPIEEGRKVLIGKYNRNLDKLTLEEAKQIAKPKYDAIMQVLGENK